MADAELVKEMLEAASFYADRPRLVAQLERTVDAIASEDAEINSLTTALKRAEGERDEARAEVKRLSEEEIGPLADVIMQEFGGPTESVGACGMAIILLRKITAERDAALEKAELLQDNLTDMAFTAAEHKRERDDAYAQGLEAAAKICDRHRAAMLNAKGDNKPQSQARAYCLGAENIAREIGDAIRALLPPQPAREPETKP